MDESNGAIMAVGRESVLKRETVERGLERGRVTVRFDARRGATGITMDNGEEPYRAFIHLAKDAVAMTEHGLSLSSKEGEPLVENFVPWDAVWAIEGQGQDASGFFAASCPPEHTKALFVQCMALRANSARLSEVIASALALVDRGASHGQWRQWRQWRKTVTALLGIGADEESSRIVKPGAPNLSVVK